MKTRIKKTIAFCMCALLMLGAAGFAAFALAGKSGEETVGENSADTGDDAAKAPAGLNETVYIIQDHDGKDKIIVSDSQSDEPRYLDEAAELPVGISVSYQLDGSDISAEDLAGKSGKVRIRFDYTNRQPRSVTVNGRAEEMYVPFAAITGLILDNENFSNIEVVNGKMLDDGDRTVIIGLAFPGLQENLDLDTATFEIPSYVEVTAETTNFKMESTYTIVTNSVFSNISTGDFGSFDGLTASAGKLTDAMTQLMSGSDDLCSGLGSLLSGANNVADGIGQLSDGLSTLSANNNTLNEGAKQVFSSLLSMADSQLAGAGLELPRLTIENYDAVLNNILSSMNADKVAENVKSQVEQAVRVQESAVRSAVTEAIRQEVSAKVAEAVRENVETQVLAGIGMKAEEYNAALSAGMVTEAQQNQISAAIEKQMESDAVKAVISAKTDEQMQSPQVLALIDSKTEEQIQNIIAQKMASEEVRAKMEEALKQVNEGAAKISSLKEQLDRYNVFYRGLRSYTEGVADAASGAKTLERTMPQLISGITALRDGAMQLSDGLKKFNEEGIRKLSDALDGDLSEISERLRATGELAKQYKSYTGNSDSVKFIYKTRAVG